MLHVPGGLVSILAPCSNGKSIGSTGDSRFFIYLQLLCCMIYQQLWHAFKSDLANAEEADVLFFILWKHNTGMARLRFDDYRNEVVADPDRWRDQLARLVSGEPIQYIVGHAEFMGLTVGVSPAVLIPRPETEELVSIALHENKAQQKRVLDIGTGSGCISLALKSKRPAWEVHAMDVSTDALAVARQNADNLNLDLSFHRADICGWAVDQQFDIIISNPPYIPEQEKQSLAANVRNHEPGEALFVPDSDPLFFYKCIASFAGNHLIKPGGKLYFETHYNYAEEVRALFAEHADKQVIEDMFGKQRFVVVYY
jgi:release factor glutamine methyltransferase